MTVLYGIPNCDTVKKVRMWLDANGIAYDFHDYKKAGVTREKLEAWSRDFGWEKLLNRAGTTFRKLDEVQKSDIDEAKAIALMMEQPSMIKRPIVEKEGANLIGFNKEQYERAFGF